MKNMYKRNIVLFLSTLFLVPATYSQQNRQTELDSMIHRANRFGVFNGNVLVIDHDKTIYHTAIGVSDASGKTPLTEQYRFHIGSIAKEFTAASIMLLVEKGKLGLHDKVSQYLPELPSWADSIELIHLLQYTSGLPDVKWNTVRSDADNMADLQQLERLKTVPGTVYAYNNNNIFLQRRIIEKVSGLSYRQFMENYMLKPAGMKTAVTDPTEATPLMTRAFNKDKKQDGFETPISGWPAMTTEDLYKWSQAVNTFKILTPASTRTILMPFQPGKQAGLGGGSMEGDKMIRHVHDGTSRNYQALLVSDPVKGRTVILFTNNMQNNLYNINNSIQAILDGQPYAQPRKAVYSLLQDQLEKLNGEQIIARFEELKKTYSEAYDFDSEGTLNGVGYYLLSNNRVDDAITVFKYNTTLFPTSGNVFDSLGEAYYKKGDKVNTLISYKRSLELDPANETAKQVIKELETK